MNFLLDSLQPSDGDPARSIYLEGIATRDATFEIEAPTWERCGFREVGRRERLGKPDGVWRDVLLLERCSKLAGT